jgi:hypothetical protein
MWTEMNRNGELKTPRSHTPAGQEQPHTYMGRATARQELRKVQHIGLRHLMMANQVETR